MSEFILTQESVDDLGNKSKLFMEQANASKQITSKSLEEIGDMISLGKYAPQTQEIIENIKSLDEKIIDALEESADSLSNYFNSVAEITGIVPAAMK